MKKLPLLVLVALLGWLPQAGFSTDLMSLYDLAKTSDPQLLSAEAALAATREGGVQARAQLYPQVNLSADASDNEQSGSQFTDKDYTLSLTQPLYRRDRMMQVGESDLLTRQAQFQLESAQQDLIVRLSQRYFDVLAAVDGLAFAQAELKAIHRQLEQTKQRFDVGLIAITDVHVAQARYDLAVSQEIVARNQLASAREALREVTGAYHPDLKTLKKDIPLVAPDPANPDKWGATALEQNPTVQAARAAADAAQREIDRLRSGHYPSLDLVASRTHTDIGGGVFGPRKYDTNALTLQFNLPLYQGGLVNSQVRQAVQRYTQARETLEQQRRAVDRQTRDAYLGVMAAISQVHALEQALISNQSALQATEAGFDVGTRTIVDVLNAQSDLFGARRDLARARYNYVVSTLQLRQAAGTLKVSDLQHVNSALQ